LVLLRDERNFLRLRRVPELNRYLLRRTDLVLLVRVGRTDGLLRLHSAGSRVFALAVSGTWGATPHADQKPRRVLISRARRPTGPLLALLLAAATCACAQASTADKRSATSGRCRVTIPSSRYNPTGFGPKSFNYGNALIRAYIYWPKGTVTAGILPDGSAMAIINKDGSIAMKMGWWRGVAGQLTIRGKRIDRSALPLGADVSSGYGSRGFQPVGLRFPSVGCWRVTGKVRNAQLSFIVKVQKVRR
jgi:hypothetical protein